MYKIKLNRFCDNVIEMVFVKRSILICFQYDSTSGWPSSMDMPPVSMYGDHLSAAAAHHSAHLNMHNPYVAAAVAANNHVANSVANHVMGANQIPDALKRDKDAIYG